MGNVAIKVKGLSKAYQLGDFGTGTISRDFERFLARIRGKEDPYLKIGEMNDRTSKSQSGVVWSLKDINIDIAQGDAIGIIGRNGAGKSTLLKILSRVTAPTTGSVKIKGRMASLLEVGTGFHPELTGKENIYLNGAILGMRKAEIKRKFDEIVDFSGVERYIDTPVKRYSSGMYVRLAFAVAAHLDSEILVVDEVLAVGDAEFQKKCLGKIGDVSKGEGRTVLFVSHNMGSINQLCSNCLLLDNGQVRSYGKTPEIINDYLNYHIRRGSYIDLQLPGINRSGNKKVEFVNVQLKKQGDDANTDMFSIGDSIELLFEMKFNSPNEQKVRTAIILKSSEGMQLAMMIDEDSKFNVKGDDNTRAAYKVTIEDTRLYPDRYYISLFAGDMSSTEAYDSVEDCISFEIIDGGLLTNRPLPKTSGLLLFTPKWELIS